MLKATTLKNILVVGRDESLWLTVNALWRAFSGTGLQIEALELPSFTRVGDVIPTLRHQAAFHELMGLKEGPLMLSSQATFSQGERYAQWGRQLPECMLGYGTVGVDLHHVRFMDYWLKATKLGLKARYEDFCLTAAAAKAGKLIDPNADLEGFAISDYAYNLGAVGYNYVLKQIALQRKVLVHEGRLSDVVLNPVTGDIEALLTADGRKLSADLYIDASGSESLLLGKALGVENQSWGQWFPCDRILNTYGAPYQPLPPFTQNTGFRSGWVGQYPLQNLTAIQQVYSSVDLKDDEAFESAGLVTSQKLNPDVVVTPYEAGMRQTQWHKNCVAVGEAGAIFDPIFNVKMQANLIALSHLIALFPLNADMKIERDEFNRKVSSSFERIRDYQIVPYKLNQRFDQPMWDHSRNMALPDSLMHKLELFFARGVVAQYDDETFLEKDWQAMLIGFGLIPQAYDPVADRADDSEVIGHFQRILGYIKLNVEKSKPMESYLQQPVMSGQ